MVRVRQQWQEAPARWHVKAWIGLLYLKHHKGMTHPGATTRRFFQPPDTCHKRNLSPHANNWGKLSLKWGLWAPLKSLDATTPTWEMWTELIWTRSSFIPFLRSSLRDSKVRSGQGREPLVHSTPRRNGCRSQSLCSSPGLSVGLPLLKWAHLASVWVSPGITAFLAATGSNVFWMNRSQQIPTAAKNVTERS